MSTTASTQSGDVLIIVGTSKGAFLFRADSARQQYEVSGPHFPGQSIHSALYIPDGNSSRILVGHKSEHWGAMVSWSDDLGKTWHEPAEGNIKFPAGSGLSVDSIWALEAAPLAGPDVVYAGVSPAALYRSSDRGQTFSINQALLDDPNRSKWQPGFGGLCLHTIAIDRDDPARMWVAISAAGVYRTLDGGESWQRFNRGVRIEPAMEPKYPDFIAQCAHKLRIDSHNPRRLYLQNHPGVYRSDNAGESWVSIANGLPSDFGFPMVTHPRRANTVYVFPLTADTYRWPPDTAARVYRTTDAGESWEALGNGLPQHGAYFTVLRDAFCCDTLDPMGLYLGTRGGHLFASADEGETWRLVAEWLPPVLCVRAASLS